MPVQTPQTMHGFLNIDKPSGMTSHDVVAQIRRATRVRRVGHAGTLDPAATGVLVVALGAATRLIEYVQDQTLKRYLACARLGVATTTDDAEGEPVATAPVPDLTRDQVAALLGGFVGEIMQTPPIYSALHHNGRRLHEIARAGETVEIAPRPVRIDQIALVAWAPPDLTIDVICGKGTYIRALARDIGAAAGCGAHLATLRRTAVGQFLAAGATPLDDLLADPGAVAAALQPPELAVADWPALTLTGDEARMLRNGMPIARAPGAGPRARAHLADGTLLALLSQRDQHWKPDKVFDWT
jgi:tRNA pseudouridine55 synthase